MFLQVMTSDDAEASLSSQAVLDPESRKPSTCPGSSNQGRRRRRRKRQLTTTPCPSPWVPTGNGHCLLVQESNKIKGEAESHCSQQHQDGNGKLMRFYDVGDFTRLYNILFSSKFIYIDSTEYRYLQLLSFTVQIFFRSK